MAAAAAAAQDPRRSELLKSERKLDEAERQVRDATRVALETEETGFAVLSDLARQRDVISRSSGHVQHIDDNITGARQVLVQMTRRALIKKLVLGAIVVILLVSLIVVVYFLFIKKDH
mmetsp:Transcript_41060/g.111011  ORF Transcript_41060/g.111011 Transcript_41060/m.111011 type:complete len:118 (-) Transcript_41060:107-460(-)